MTTTAAQHYSTHHHSHDHNVAATSRGEDDSTAKSKDKPDIQEVCWGKMVSGLSKILKKQNVRGG